MAVKDDNEMPAICIFLPVQRYSVVGIFKPDVLDKSYAAEIKSDACVGGGILAQPVIDDPNLKKDMQTMSEVIYV